MYCDTVLYFAVPWYLTILHTVLYWIEVYYYTVLYEQFVGRGVELVEGVSSGTGIDLVKVPVLSVSPAPLSPFLSLYLSLYLPISLSLSTY